MFIGKKWKVAQNIIALSVLHLAYTFLQFFFAVKRAHTNCNRSQSSYLHFIGKSHLSRDFYVWYRGRLHVSAFPRKSQPGEAMRSTRTRSFSMFRVQEELLFIVGSPAL